ncbi:class I SAM-dependent methyltransferase [Streptomyces sp. NPDC048172]|uniref:class I SAM-dependent methyltransferase n=1 Tax=Streptomyces sp. NPDC048172 TaxID=3365505 RepID=UPI00371E7CAE
MKSNRLSPIWARQYDRLSEKLEHRFDGSRLRSGLVGNLTGRVVEIGAGTGRNLPHYAEADHVVAVEPSAGMRSVLEGRVASAPVSAEMRVATGERLPFADEEFDAAVGTLLLCVVDDPRVVLAEIHRVLRPGGVFSFFEHVRDTGARGRKQDRWEPVLRRALFGCRPNRRTLDVMRETGFDVRSSAPPVEFSPKPPLSGPYLTGTATRL